MTGSLLPGQPQTARNHKSEVQATHSPCCRIPPCVAIFPRQLSGLEGRTPRRTDAPNEGRLDCTDGFSPHTGQYLPTRRAAAILKPLHHRFTQRIQDFVGTRILLRSPPLSCPPRYFSNPLRHTISSIPISRCRFMSRSKHQEQGPRRLLTNKNNERAL